MFRVLERTGEDMNVSHPPVMQHSNRCRRKTFNALLCFGQILVSCDNYCGYVNRKRESYLPKKRASLNKKDVLVSGLEL